MKKLLCMVCAAMIMLALPGCFKTKTLHCDHCGKEISVRENSNMDEGWIIYCAECEEELFGDNPIVTEG